MFIFISYTDKEQQAILAKYVSNYFVNLSELSNHSFNFSLFILDGTDRYGSQGNG